MKKHLKWGLITLSLVLILILSTLLISADADSTLTPVGNKPTAWLSAREGDSIYTHDLRVVLAIPEGVDESAMTVTLTFEGENAPDAISFPLPKLPLYRSVKAGGTTYQPAEGATLRVLTKEGLADGSYTSLILTLEDDGKTLYTATQTAQVLGDSANLTLTPWNLSLTDWMGALPDSRSLAELTIPGTHDSGALIEISVSQCQSLSIAEQLSSGVRFLDIRLRLEDDGLNVYHGIVPQELSFEAVRADCKAFLEAHPGEVILMSIKQEDDSNASFPSAIAAAIAEDPDLWYTGSTLPTLGQARGKIVLIRRYSGASIGINCATGWADNTNFTMNNGVSMKVQDYYSLEQSANLDTKWSKITVLAEAAAKSDSAFCINFTSGYTLTFGIIPNITAVSDSINPKLLDYASSLPQGGYGTFVVDFITSEIASALIATNFPE